MAQLRAFLAAIARSDAASDARFLSLVAMATRGDGGALNKALDRLTQQAEKP